MKSPRASLLLADALLVAGAVTVAVIVFVAVAAPAYFGGSGHSAAFTALRVAAILAAVGGVVGMAQINVSARRAWSHLA